MKWISLTAFEPATFNFLYVEIMGFHRSEYRVEEF
jgi:hypothetical protein